jgi:hypothetical protein
MAAEAMTHIDSAGLQALVDLAGTLRSDGIAVHFARAKYPTADRIVQRVSGARFHGTVRAAVETKPSCPRPSPWWPRR